MKDNGRFVRELDFHLLLRAILRRLKALLSEFSEEQWDLKEDELFKNADQIQLITNKLHWEDQTRYSSRQKTKQLMGGLRGHIELEGNLNPYMPLLRAAEIIHLGKETSFGLGKTRLEVLK